MKPTIAVIGGGITGLNIAYELVERADKLSREVEVVCFEADERAGGNVRSARDGEFLFEWAANGFLDSAPATVALVQRLGLESRAIRARDSAAKRYIYRRGRLRRVPLLPAAFLGSDVVSPLGKLRILCEPFVAARREQSEESVFDFASRRIGREAASVLVDAMVSGVYAGNTRKLSLQATFPKMHEMEDEHGGLFRAMLARRRRARESGAAVGGPAGPAGTLTSFIDGMQELTDALACALGPRLRPSTPIIQLSDLGRRGYRLHPHEGAPIDVDAVVVACPAWNASSIVEPLDRELAGTLDGIPSAGVAVVHLGFRSDTLGPRPVGFGFLVPRGQGPRILGALWPSDIFEGRAPDGSVLMTVMLGGAHDPQAVALDDNELLQAARTDLRQVLGIVTEPWFVRIVRHPRGIPQYEIGHVERLRDVERRLAELPGLWLTGNSLHGISINACIEQAPQVAKSALNFVGERIRTAAGA